MRRKLLPLIAVSFLLFGVETSLALTLSDIRTAIRRNVRDNPVSSSNRRYTDASLLVYINEAQRSAINDTWASSDDTTHTLVSGTSYYSLPTESIKPWRVTLNGANLPELNLSQLDADNADTAWWTSGTPTNFFYERSNPTQIGLVPYPSSSGATLKIFYYQLVPDLASDSDVPFDGDVRLYSYHDLLIYFVSFRLLTSEHRMDEAQTYQTIYDAGIQVMNTNVGHKLSRPAPVAKEQIP